MHVHVGPVVKVTLSNSESASVYMGEDDGKSLLTMWLIVVGESPSGSDEGRYIYI